MAVGFQANVGGAASAPIVAAVFSSLACPVGVLLSVLLLLTGTYAVVTLPFVEVGIRRIKMLCYYLCVIVTREQARRIYATKIHNTSLYQLLFSFPNRN
jgi:hypothetical protein